MLVSLDIRTLTLMMGFTFLTLCLSMVYYSLNNKTYDGFGLWTLGINLVAVSLILVGFRQIIPDLVTIVLANAFIYSGLFLLYLGFTCFAEKKVRKEFHIAVGVLIVFILFPIFTYIYPNVSARIIMISFVAAFYFTLSTRIVFRNLRHIQNKVNIQLTASLAVMASLFVLRGLFYLIPVNHSNNFMSPNVGNGFMLALVSVSLISFVIGLMQLNSSMLEKEQKDLINELKNALGEIKTLRGIVPICSHCKKIRDDKGYWNQIEEYISRHSEAVFSHGICQECAEKYYPDMDLYGEDET